MTSEARQRARDSINSRPLTDFVSLVRTKGGLYECPVCHSGTGPHRTGALSITPDGRRVTCFAKHCFGEKGEDTLGALRIIWGVSETEVFHNVGIDTGGPLLDDPQKKINPPKVERKPEETTHADFTEYITKSMQDLQTDQGARAYLTGRGITAESMTRYHLGYDPDKRAIVVPYGRKNRYYITRSIEGKAYRKPPRSKAGEEPLYNPGCLYAGGGHSVFVTESVFCAISIMQAGGAAVAIGGTGAEKLIKQITAQPTQKALVLCLDNDEPGQTTQATLAAKLEEIGATFTTYNVAGAYKDPNEYLQADKEAFTQAVLKGKEEGRKAISERELEEKRERGELAYQFKAKYSAAGRINSFLDGIAASVNNPPQPTGFQILDSILDGGIYSGYIILTGGTSVGKTAITLQIADSIARAGRDVLYFTLEMTAADLMARTISRLTYQNCGGNVGNAKTARYITDGSKRALYSKAEEDLVADSTLEYAETIAPHICFIEPWQMHKEFLSTDDIRKVLEEYTKGKNPEEQGPFVVVDYAQLLRPGEKAQGTDAKQNMSNTATVLYHISKEYNIPLLAITSQPRSEYGQRDSMNAGKESGDLEYSAEYLFRLQFPRPTKSEEKETPGTYEKKQKRKDPRTVELAIMKNRSGQTGDTVKFNYYAKFNCFEEVGKLIEE